MTLQEWESRLVQSLSGLSQTEIQTVLDYYREIYGDKLEAGYTAEQIVREFGAPEDCAQKILAGEPNQPSFSSSFQSNYSAKKSSYSVGALIGLALMTLFLVIPLYSIIFSVLATCVILFVTGGAFVIGGGLYTVISPFYLGINGVPFGGVFANVGLGIALAGVGFLLMVAFYYLTKYVVEASVKLFKMIYGRGKR